MIDEILAGTGLALIGAGIGSIFGNKGKMTDSHCSERQTACSALIYTRLDNIERGLKESKDTTKEIALDVKELLRRYLK